VEGVVHARLGDLVISASALQTILSSGIGSFTRVDTYVVGTYTFTTSGNVVQKGSFSSALGLAPPTLDFTVCVGGSGSSLAAFKAAALVGTLDGLVVTWSVTINGASALKFTGTVQRAEPSSTEVRIVAISTTVTLAASRLPKHVVLPAEFPEIPPPEDYCIR
jgi:hypothetical protein